MDGAEKHHVLDELLAESVGRLKEQRGPTVRKGPGWEQLPEEDPYVPEVRAPAPQRGRTAEQGGAEATSQPEVASVELRARLTRQRRRNLRLARELERREAELARVAQERDQLRSRVARLEEELAEAGRRERELAARLEEERLRRGRAELELERLKGRVAVLKPLLDGLAKAGEELGLAGRPGERPPLAPEPSEQEPPKGGLMRALAGAVEQWRGPGPRPVR
jgi:septal ring factor EnvC (AmiA/AmiB activator)